MKKRINLIQFKMKKGTKIFSFLIINFLDFDLLQNWMFDFMFQINL